MTSFIYLKFAILLLHLPWTALAQDNPTSSPGDKSGTNINTTTNASTICELRIRDKSEIENILRLMHKYTTRVVEIKVSINSGNESRTFPELVWPWASEIGRTIISLIERSNALYDLCSSRLGFLNVGIERANVVVSEENYGCLPNGSNGYEAVFDFLVHQLSHSDDTHDYKLCRAFSNENELKQYNCCRVVGGANLTICAEYSSSAVKTGETVIFLFTIIILCFNLPLISYYLRSFPNEREYYEITESPLALSTIFHTLFIYGNYRLRRFAFWLTVAVIFSLISSCHLYLIIAVFIPPIPFACVDIFSINEENNDRQINNYNTYINNLTLPWNLKFWRSIFTWIFSHCATRTARVVFLLLSPLFFLLAFVLVVLIIAISWIFAFYSSVSPLSELGQLRVKGMLRTYLEILALGVLIMFTFISLIFTMLLVAAVYLNGEFYGPIIVPVIGLVVYCFKHWRWFVEIKYLVLKTNIHEVCKDLRKEPYVQKIPKNREGFTVDVNEGRIPKTLYNKIREKLLPYDKALLDFFTRMIFVGGFFLLLYAMMSLAQKSNISGPAQIISSMIVSTIPFTFDTIWAEDTFEQKDANSKDQKQKIRQMMVLNGINGSDTNVIIVEAGGEADNLRRQEHNWKDLFRWNLNLSMTIHRMIGNNNP